MRPPTVLALLVAVASSGCYYFQPRGIHKTERPQLVDGAELELHADEDYRWTECTERQIERDYCTLRGGTWKRKETYVDVTFSYAGKALTRGEVRSLIDDKYDEKWSALERKKSVCKRSLVPTVIGVLGYIAVPLTLSDKARAKFGEENYTPFYIATGVGVGGALASYVLGGYACRPARALANELGAYRANEKSRRYYRGEPSDVQSAKELGRVVEEFNRKMRATTKLRSEVVDEPSE